MGKGDRKTAKGKRYNSSYGNVRSHAVKKAAGAVQAPVAKKVAKAAVKPSAAKPAPAAKAPAKKAITRKPAAKG